MQRKGFQNDNFDCNTVVGLFCLTRLNRTKRMRDGLWGHYMGDCYNKDDYWVDFLLREIHLFVLDLYFLFHEDLLPGTSRFSTLKW